MFTWNNGEYVESETYKKKVLSEPFLFEDIEDILRHISAQYNVEFIPQRAFEGNETHYNFYFHSTGNHNNDSRILEALVRYANDQNYTARFSRSNPLAGDPENAYDAFDSHRQMRKIICYSISDEKIQYTSKINIRLEIAAMTKHI